MAHMERRLWWFVFLILFYTYGQIGSASDPEIIIHDLPVPWTGVATVPVYVDISSSFPTTARVVVKSDNYYGSYTSVRNVAIAAGRPSRIELTGIDLSGSSFQVTCAAGGAVKERHLYRNWEPMRDSSPIPFVCVNGYQYRELIAEAGTERPVMPVTSSELPRRWQSYSSLAGIFIVSAEDVVKLDHAQRGAMGFWLKWMGGRMWILGPDAENAADSMALTNTAAEDVGEGVRVRNCLRGAIFTLEAPLASSVIRFSPKDMQEYGNGQLADYENFLVQRDVSNEVVTDFGGVSTAVIIACLIVFGLLIGPLNYLYLRRRGESLLFFVTTPAVALLGTVIILAASALAEGVGTAYRESAVLVQRENSDEAILLNARGMRPGFFRPDLRYPLDSMVIPLRRSWRDDEVVVEESGAAASLSAGWVMPRATSGVAAAMPVTGRFKVDLEQVDGRWYAVNGLGFSIIKFAAKLPDGSYGRAENVAAGGRKALKIENNDDYLDLLQDKAQDATGIGRNLVLAAECEGLPYIEPWGITGTRLSGSYYYLVESDGRKGGVDD